jgi:hypothetical protein
MFIGNGSGRINTAGIDNVAVGYQALYDNTTGSYNTANGYVALSNNTTGSYNTANGVSALYSNTTGSYNTANGYFALYQNTTGFYNTANGYEALFNNTTGDSNVANGFVALQFNKTGSNNTANGYYALRSNAAGNNNTATGGWALTNATGSYNTANGFGALEFNSTGYSNTANGYNTGLTNTVGGSNSFLGAYSDVGSGNLINATAIGANALVASNDSLVLGSIYGVNSATGSAKIGIGTTAPKFTLDVNGGYGSNALVSLNQKNLGDLFTASSSGTTKFTIKNDGTASTSGGLTFDGGGAIQSTKNQNLTIGGDSTGNITFSPKNGLGSVTIGTSTNGLVFDTVNGGPTYAGTARPTKTITLSPEYAGAVLTPFYGAGTDTSITGSMTSDTDTTVGTSIRNYYQWLSTSGSQQFYTVAVRVTLPQDFSGWATSNAVVVNYITQNASTATSTVETRIYRDGSATLVASSTGASTTWNTQSWGASSLTNWNTADQTAVIYLRLGSTSSNYARVGDIKLNYLSKF